MKINVLLRKWVKDEILEDKDSVDSGSDNSVKDNVFFCSLAAEISHKLGYLEEAVELYERSLCIKEKNVW